MTRSPRPITHLAGATLNLVTTPKTSPLSHIKPNNTSKTAAQEKIFVRFDPPYTYLTRLDPTFSNPLEKPDHMCYTWYMTDVPSPKSWHQQPDEPPDWFNRFHTYLTLGPSRTLESALGLRANSKSTSSSTVSKQAAKWR